MTEFRLETIHLDLPGVSGAFARRLHDAGVPVTATRAAWFARALDLVRPISRRRLYWIARSVFLTDLSQLAAFDRVFAGVFTGRDAYAVDEAADLEPSAPDERAAAGEAPRAGAGSSSAVTSAITDRAEPAPGPDLPVPVLTSDEEVLRHKHFDTLSSEELSALYSLMHRLRIATPRRTTRRRERAGQGPQIDLRRTLRASLRTAAEPVRLRRRRRRVLPRRLVVLCDISGSMEPYARAYLQFLTCAAGSGRRAEVFVFATRLTRLTRALRSRSPERALRQAAATAPDWSSGTRIGDALKEFNQRHGRRGMARGAVVVILSDGWERGEPAQVAREMERLHRLAHRIVWVNPRVGADAFAPRAGGMRAALPFCDALLSGHSLAALDAVVQAIAGGQVESPPHPRPTEDDEEPWASATPVPGSSVAMPSGYGPSRGRTTPGWSLRP